jgi:hypothetical protein
MGELIQTIGNKAPGQLIRSQDWNVLVNAVESLETTLTSRIDTLEQKVTADIELLKTDVAKLRTDLNALSTAIDPLLRQYYRVTIQTSIPFFVLGELAELTAHVTDARGNAPAERPWIDFVAAWGQLKPANGFESVGGAGDRTISVRVNSQGIARVLLRSEHAEGFTDDDEREIAAAMTTRLQANNQSISHSFWQAATPMEAKTNGSFAIMTKEYDRADSRVMRDYIDGYYMRHAGLVAGKTVPGLVDHYRTTWRDYQATVMAFARSDSESTTADQSSGVGSIQVTFRDWISSWLWLDYIDTESVKKLANDFRDRVAIKITNKYDVSIKRVKDDVTDFVRDRGLVGKLQRYRAVDEGLGGLGGPQEFLDRLTGSMQNAIAIQQILESTQAATIGVDSEQVAFTVFTDAATRADVNVAEVAGRLDDVSTQVGQTKKQLDTLSPQVSGLATTVASFSDVRGSLFDIQGKMERQFSDFTTQVSVLNERTNNILNQSTRFKTDIDTVKGQLQPLQAINLTKLVLKDDIGREVNDQLIKANVFR